MDFIDMKISTIAVAHSFGSFSNKLNLGKDGMQLTFTEDFQETLLL